MTAFVLTLVGAALAVGLELLEALAIVLAVGSARRPRDAVLGAAGAVVLLAIVVVVVGPLVLARLPLDALHVVIGTALLLFGLEWLRKGILRLAGLRRRSSSYEEFIVERQALGGATAGGAGTDWAARLVAFKGVFLEGMEVGLIVLALGGGPGRLAPALLGAAVALMLVVAIGIVLHRPLQRLPETQLKLGVGVALTAFGTFFSAEGLGVEWPLGDLALLYLAGVYGITAWLTIGVMARAVPIAEAT
jgi:Ca2+/H+ antiporter, TMEM165/GDT1 family